MFKKFIVFHNGKDILIKLSKNISEINEINHSQLCDEIKKEYGTKSDDLIATGVLFDFKGQKRVIRLNCFQKFDTEELQLKLGLEK